MKLKRIRAGHYEGRLEPFQVTIYHDQDGRGCWIGSLMSGEEFAATAIEDTLKEVKSALTIKWIRKRIKTLCEVVPSKDAMFYELVNSCIPLTLTWNSLTPLALWDYLEERGWHHFADIIRDGRAAGVDWPRGWDKLGG